MPNITKEHLKDTLDNAMRMLAAVKAAVEAGYTTTDIPAESGGTTLERGTGLAVGRGTTGCRPC